MSENESLDTKSDAELVEIEAEKKYARAALIFDKGDIDEALMLVRGALNLCPTSPKFHYNAAYMYWRKGLLEIAINHYKLFLRYAPKTDKDIPVIESRIKYLEKEITKRFKPSR